MRLARGRVASYCRVFADGDGDGKGRQTGKPLKRRRADDVIDTAMLTERLADIVDEHEERLHALGFEGQTTIGADLPAGAGADRDVLITAADMARESVSSGTGHGIGVQDAARTLGMGSGFDRYRRLGCHRKQTHDAQAVFDSVRCTKHAPASDRVATSSLTFACRTTTDTVESAIPRRSAISAVE